MPKNIDATAEGVSEEEQNKLVEDAKKNAGVERLSAMQELAIAARERRDADLEAEGLEVVDTSGKSDEDDDEIKTDRETDATIKKELDTLNASEDDEDEPAPGKKAEVKEETRILIVDGEEREVPLSKILDSGIRTLQKESAADKRLQEANELLKLAKEKAASPSNQDASMQENDSTPSNEDAEQLAKVIIDGDLDEVTNVVQKLMGSGRRESKEMATHLENLDQSQIYGFVQDALKIEQAMDRFKEAPEKGGFGDLYEDAQLRKMVMDKEEELVNNGDTRGYVERLEAAATEVRNWRDGIAQKAGLIVSGFKDTQDKKKQSASTIDAAGGRNTNSQDEKKPLSREEKRKLALNKMASSRGNQLD